MQHIVIEKPYRFISPHRGNWWPTVIQTFRLIDYWLRKSHGVVRYECRGIDHLKDSITAGHGVMLTPNHCRPSDPIVMGFPARLAKTHLYAMASWHLYNQSRFTAFAIRKMGAFSVNREGVDRQAINTAIEILASAERPLIVFPEGATTRMNDRLHDFLDGVAFIARIAAKKRSKANAAGKVVVHSVAVKYLFEGDLHAAVEPTLAAIEQRLMWQVATDMPLLQRISRLGKALLSLKEMEYLGTVQSGGIAKRCETLIDRLLSPIEKEWLGGQKEEGTIPRVKSLRMAIVPDMTRNELPAAEHARRWKNLADIYLAQQLSCYPEDYLDPPTTIDRILETVERMEEDVTDEVTPHLPIKVIIQIGAPIEVPRQRDRNAGTDPLMIQVRTELQAMLDKLAAESPIYDGS